MKEIFLVIVQTLPVEKVDRRRKVSEKQLAPLAETRPKSNDFGTLPET
jgi:hypothetical protein